MKELERVHERERGKEEREVEGGGRVRERGREWVRRERRGRQEKKEEEGGRLRRRERETEKEGERLI